MIRRKPGEDPTKRISDRRRRGTAMIETAMTLPIILLVLLGTVEFGLLFSRYQILLGSAREGARIASLFRMDCNPYKVKGEVDAAVMNNGSQLGMLLLPTNVQVVGACKNGNVTVEVKYDHYLTLLGGFVPSDLSVPLEVTVVMRNESS
jgi:Flp pilus assembly protein TadG